MYTHYLGISNYLLHQTLTTGKMTTKMAQHACKLDESKQTTRRKDIPNSGFFTGPWQEVLLHTERRMQFTFKTAPNEVSRGDITYQNEKT